MKNDYIKEIAIPDSLLKNRKREDFIALTLKEHISGYFQRGDALLIDTAAEIHPNSYVILDDEESENGLILREIIVDPEDSEGYYLSRVDNSDITEYTPRDFSGRYTLIGVVVALTRYLEPISEVQHND